MATGPAGIVPQLMPLKSIWCGAFSPGTADTAEGCFCEDKAGYVIKSDTPSSPKASHNEWLCANLAVQAGVPLLGFNLVETTSGEIWFGSEWFPGEIKDWWNSVTAGTISLDDLRDDLSRIYTFDLFVNNIDRHSRNYIVRAEGAGHRIYAMDHGRSWMFSGFPPPLLPLPPCNTVSFRDWMKINFSMTFVDSAMLEVIEKLKTVNVTDIENVLSKQPSNWLTSDENDAVLNWWNDGDAAARIESIVDGIGDGSLL
jgi:hypothetical protein